MQIAIKMIYLNKKKKRKYFTGNNYIYILLL